MSYGGPDEKRAQFEVIALPLMTALYNVAVRLTRNAEDAADAVQETFYRAYRTFENFRPGTNARSWLFTILYSVVINRQKKAEREARDVSIDEMEQRFYQYLDATAVGDEPAEVLDAGKLDSPEIEAALQALPEAFRSAVLMVDVQELSYEEAARVLDCPVGTLRSRLFRGRRLLFGALQDYAHRAGYMRSADP
ncbi:MAG: sigma-70 family RNA polymerase sigma factor [Longimicrobiales bacterium]